MEPCGPLACMEPLKGYAGMESMVGKSWYFVFNVDDIRVFSVANRKQANAYSNPEKLVPDAYDGYFRFSQPVFPDRKFL